MLISSSGWLVGLLALPGLSAFQGPTPANDAKRLSGKDDEDFARALNARGYDDLAQKIIDAIKRQGGSSPEAALRADAISFDLLQSQAERTQDPAQAAKLLGEEFHRHLPIQAEVVRQPDVPHPAVADPALEPPLSFQRLAGPEREPCLPRGVRRDCRGH